MKQLRLFALCILIIAVATTQAQSLIPELSFKNPVLKTGEGCMGDGLDGAVYIFENVGWGMDAMVTILGRSSDEVHLTEADIQGPDQQEGVGTGSDNAWQPGVQFANGCAKSHQNWWMEFKVSFVKNTDHETSISVNQFNVSGLDIDGDGDQLREFQTYYKTHSYSLGRQTAIFTSAVQGAGTNPLLQGKCFRGTTKNYEGISTVAADAMVNNYYTGVSSMIVRLGAETGSSGTTASGRMYGLLFRSLVYDVPGKRKTEGNLIASNGSTGHPVKEQH